MRGAQQTGNVHHNKLRNAHARAAAASAPGAQQYMPNAIYSNSTNSVDQFQFDFVASGTPPMPGVINEQGNVPTTVASTDYFAQFGNGQTTMSQKRNLTPFSARNDVTDVFSLLMKEALNSPLPVQQNTSLFFDEIWKTAETQINTEIALDLAKRSKKS